MKSSCSPMGVIFRVGELKAAFIEAKENLSQKSHSNEPSDQTLLLLKQVTIGLELLRAFNNEDYLALPAIPAEIASATDPLSRTVKDYYVQNRFAVISNEVAQKLE